MSVGERARSSMDRASAFEAEGCRFEPCRAHHLRRSLRPKRGGMSLRPPRALAHIFARQFGIWCTHTGRDTGAEGGTHDPFFEDVCGSLWRGCDWTGWGLGFLNLARINAGGHV